MLEFAQSFLSVALTSNPPRGGTTDTEIEALSAVSPELSKGSVLQKKKSAFIISSTASNFAFSIFAFPYVWDDLLYV